MTDDGDIRFEVIGRAGIITLAKPETLNAVTDVMLSQIDQHLTAWENDQSVERVVIKAVEGRAFSAGGDIRHLYEQGLAGDYDYDFFAREYALNVRIHHYAKPYVALIDGIVMGGGVGVSFHGSHRIAGDNIAFAMPEVGIGFFPDVGGSYLLSRLPGSLGLYLGLTGNRLQQAACVESGLATHAVASRDFAVLEERLCEAETVEEALSDPKTELPIDEKDDMRFADELFSGESVEQILTELQKAAGDRDAKSRWAAATLKTMDQKSPTSLKIAFEQIKRGGELSMAECMRMEYRILRRLLPKREFYEGIRAAIIEKDRSPKWSPDRLADVTDEDIEAYFAPLGDDELVLS